MQALGWNLDCTVVAVREGVVLGTLTLWDSGHPIVYIENFQVAPAYRGKALGYRVMKFTEQWAREHGKKAIMGPAHDPAYLELVTRYGGQVGTTPHYMVSKVL